MHIIFPGRHSLLFSTLSIPEHPNRQKKSIQAYHVQPLNTLHPGNQVGTGAPPSGEVRNRLFRPLPPSRAHEIRRPFPPEVATRRALSGGNTVNFPRGLGLVWWGGLEAGSVFLVLGFWQP